MAVTTSGNVIVMGAATAETISFPTGTRNPIVRIMWTPSAASKALTIRAGTTAGSGTVLFTFTSVTADAAIAKLWDVVIEPGIGINVAVTSGEAQAYLYMRSGNQ